MSVYTGSLDSAGGKGHTKKVVLGLMENHLNCGHSIFMDNFYVIVDLAKELLRKKIYCIGMLRGNRKGNPKQIINAKLQKGQSLAKYQNGLLVRKWRDKRDVLYLSTEFKNNLIEYENRRGDKITKLLPILKHNEFMSGVDRKDQMMAYYPCERKTLRWYKKLGIHLFQLILVNSHYLYNKHCGQKMTHKKKKCRVCTQKKLRKDTIYECGTCPEKSGLCLNECFIIYHREKDLL
ncbi:hypothetical protein NQ314_013871 [Rhamnusium bicolor]|uniref:PiggyBac transposable element-derived protein domain-containing protein n=1 Tax=Rhamnusium bicolor TaxID=1586634 RepID=A0AAV8X4Q4_9CUCU|nr:hypothetical protein NQ314_013871 [Rhamnusium bicolor]